MGYLNTIFRQIDRQLSKPFYKHSLINRNQLLEQPMADITICPWSDIEQFTYTDVHTIQPLHDEYALQGTEFISPNPFVLNIEQATLRGRHAAVPSKDGAIVLESLMGYETYLEITSFGRVHYPKSIGQLWQQLSVSRHFECVAPLVNAFSRGFYHWMLECLPRLLLVEDYAQTSGKKATILIDPAPPKWTTETLTLLGYKAGKDFVEWDATFATTDNTIVPMFIYETGLPSPHLCRRVTERLKAGLPSNTNNFDSPYIYISRKQAKSRRVINEDALLQLLKPYGFEIYELENLTVAEQIQLFSQAKFIIAPHGAGLANIIHSHDLTLIEFFEPDYVNTCFYRLASGLDFRYGCYIGSSEGKNIVVEIEAVEKLVKALL